MADDKARLFSLAWRAVAPSTVPNPVTEFSDHGIPARRFRFDFAWPDFKTVVEVDGGQFLVRYDKRGRALPVGSHNKDADRDRDNLCVFHGWQVFRFSVQQLERDPAGCVMLIAEYLRKRIAEREK